MISYSDLYEFLRREKQGEQLQSVPADFIRQFSDYMTLTRKKFSNVKIDSFSEEILKEKKQYENAMTIFKELMLRRKRKILDLVFVAAETGTLKTDLSDMLKFEQTLFEKLVLAIGDAGKDLTELLNGKPLESISKTVEVQEDIEQFVDMSGEVIGPFKKGSKVSLDSQIAEILVSGGKAKVSDE